MNQPGFDMIAIRKNHRIPKSGLKRGDLLQIVLIQVKGGSSSKPSPCDLDRLVVVAKHYRACIVVLSTWIKGHHVKFQKLVGKNWVLCEPSRLFS